MPLRRVAISGADDDVDPSALLKVSQAYPYVEWALLAARDEFGKPRYPTPAWFKKMHAAIEAAAQEQGEAFVRPRFAVHFCDDWAKELAHGNSEGAFGKLVTDALAPFSTEHLRIQINFNRQLLDGSLDADKLVAALLALPVQYEYIFQLPSFEHAGLVMQARKAGVNASAFFDPSAGMGKSPEGWPRPPDFGEEVMAAQQECAGRWWVGFAGGLGPHNITSSLEEMSGKCGDTSFWVDMETKVRTEKKLDFAKVTQVLEAASAFLQAP